MTLTDAGPLMALINRNDRHHAACLAATARLAAEPLLTTWPCFAEAMHLVGKAGGHRFQGALWTLWAKGALVLHEASRAEVGRMEALMEKYRDTPMDLGRRVAHRRRGDGRRHADLHSRRLLSRLPARERRGAGDHSHLST